MYFISLKYIFTYENAEYYYRIESYLINLMCGLVCFKMKISVDEESDQVSNYFNFCSEVGVYWSKQAKGPR